MLGDQACRKQTLYARSLITSGLQGRKYPKQFQKSYEPIVPYVLPFSFEKILGASRLHNLAPLKITFNVFHVQWHASPGSKGWWVRAPVLFIYNLVSMQKPAFTIRLSLSSCISSFLFTKPVYFKPQAKVHLFSLRINRQIYSIISEFSLILLQARLYRNP